MKSSQQIFVITFVAVLAMFGVFGEANLPGQETDKDIAPSVLKGDEQKARLLARIVLFVDQDKKPPKDYELRLGSLGTRTESLFETWMKHWERETVANRIFARGDGNDKGKIQVTVVKGKLRNSNGRAALPEIRKLAIEGAGAQLDLESDKQVVWWIFYYYDGVRGFRGAGGINGGVAINAYPPGVGEIDQKLELAAPALADANIKGTIHEFGHALGLPHTGPRPDLELGNSLMGPINRAFAAKSGSADKRVYLSESSAAMLWKHPIFQIQQSASPAITRRVELANFIAKESNDGKKIIFKGTLRSNQPAHAVVVFNSSRGQFGRDYWARSWVGQVDDEGKFEITIVNPFDEGKMYLSFCFDDGVNTADGRKQLLRGSVLEIPIVGKPGSREFQSPKPNDN